MTLRWEDHDAEPAALTAEKLVAAFEALDEMGRRAVEDRAVRGLAASRWYASLSEEARMDPLIMLAANSIVTGTPLHPTVFARIARRAQELGVEWPE